MRALMEVLRGSRGAALESATSRSIPGPSAARATPQLRAVPDSGSGSPTLEKVAESLDAPALVSAADRSIDAHVNITSQDLKQLASSLEGFLSNSPVLEKLAAGDDDSSATFSPRSAIRRALGGGYGDGDGGSSAGAGLVQCLSEAVVGLRSAADELQRLQTAGARLEKRASLDRGAERLVRTGLAIDEASAAERVRELEQMSPVDAVHHLLGGADASLGGVADDSAGSAVGGAFDRQTMTAEEALNEFRNF